eukprot:130290-Hanusia_phi.AAC.3
MKQRSRCSHRRMSAEIDFSGRREPSQVKAMCGLEGLIVIRGREEGCLRERHLCCYAAHHARANVPLPLPFLPLLLLTGHGRNEANSGRVPPEDCLGECVHLKEPESRGPR